MIDSKSHVLLVGDRGMLAGAIRSQLIDRGASISGVDRDECDITDPLSVDQTLDSTKPTLVINCAAYTNVDGCETNRALADGVNGYGVGNLARACKARGITIVHYSTDYVFDGSLRRPLKIDDPVGPVSAYGKSKLLGETLLREHAPSRWLLIRTAWLYGPGGPNFPTAILNAAKAGKPLRVVCDQFGSPTFTFDLAAGTLRLLDSNVSGVFHLTNSDLTNWCDFAKAVLEEFGVEKSVEPITAEQWKQIKPDSAARPAYSVLDLGEYTRATGREMPTWRDALTRYREIVTRG